MAFSLTQLSAIEDGIAAGTTTVSYDGKSVTYRSLDEMLRIRNIIQRALGLIPQSSATVLVAHDRGFPGPSTFGDDGLQNRVLMNFLDKAISAVSPRRGVERARARMALRIYEGAAVGRRSSSWRALHTAANAEIQLALRPLRDRARELSRNSPHAPRMLDILVSHTVGTGISPVSATGSDRTDRIVDEMWEEWQEKADVTGQLSFNAIQALAVRSMVESGEVVLRFIDRPMGYEGMEIPFQLQVLESDYIDQFRDGIYGDMGAPANLKKTRLGVGLGEFDKRLGLWLWPFHPGEITTYNLRPLVSAFTPGEDLVHMFRVLRPGQVRGVPWFAPILTTARELADFVDAQNVKARVEACFAAFISNDDSTAPLLDPSSAGTDQTIDLGNPNAMVTSLEPGMIKELRTGQDIKFAQPTSNTQMEPMLLFNLQAMAAGIGCTYDQVSGDLRQANYSSLRAGKLDFWRLISILQAHTVVPMLCQRVRDRFISRAILAGTLRERRGGYPCQWVTPAREAIDPKKDLDAEVHEVRAGGKTPQQFIASRGGNWQRSIEDRATFFEMADKMGQVFDIDSRKVDQHGRAPAVKTGASDSGDAATAEDDASDLLADAESANED